MKTSTEKLQGINNPEVKEKVSVQEEIKISRYFDGEATFFEKLNVKALLVNNSAAQAYYDSLYQVANQVGEYDNKIEVEVESLNLKIKSEDMWDKILNRLEQEEKAEILLGRRVLSSNSSSPSLFQKFNLLNINWDKFGWGVSGSLATATIMMLVFSNKDNQTQNIRPSFTSASQLSPTQAAPAIKNVSSGGNSRGSIYMNRPIEVDWMRSDGRVHVIQDPNSNSSIIWVKRRPRLAPVPNIRDHDQDYDYVGADTSTGGQSLAINDSSSGISDSNKDRPVILNERAPRTVSVSQSKGR